MIHIMNSTEIFNYLVEKFEKNNVEYVILHSYQKLPYVFESDIDIAINVKDIKTAIKMLNDTLKDTDWRVIQYWRHEHYAADCVISNDKEFLQVDFCIHYERNGRVVIPIDLLVKNRRKTQNFYIPAMEVEFTYILLKKILKKYFSEGSKVQLINLIKKMTREEYETVIDRLSLYFNKMTIEYIMSNIKTGNFDIDMNLIHEELIKNTSNYKDNLKYRLFDLKRKLELIIHPTGLFVVLLGVDGAGKTTISDKMREKYTTAFRRISHYHSRVRKLKDISQINNKNKITDASNPHKKEHRSGKMVSLIKLIYYFVDFLIGNIVITLQKIRSTLVVVERYYYDYMIDKLRYNINLPDSLFRFFGFFIKKPDVVVILTGDSSILLDRKREITLEEINKQKALLEKEFKKDCRAVFVDTTTLTVDECVDAIIKKCNDTMRNRRKWQ